MQNAGGNSNWTVIGTAGGGGLNTAQAGGGNGIYTLPDNGVTVPGTGILIVYIDNQSIGKDVWFDNLNVENYSSDVVEEDHYYPYGLAELTYTISPFASMNNNPVTKKDPMGLVAGDYYNRGGEYLYNDGKGKQT